MFGNGQSEMSEKEVLLPLFAKDAYVKVNCRVIPGKTELLLGSIWATENDIILRPKTSEIKFGHEGKWGKLLKNRQGHLTLQLGPNVGEESRAGILKNRERKWNRKIGNEARVNRVRQVCILLEEKADLLVKATEELTGVKNSLAKRSTFFAEDLNLEIGGIGKSLLAQEGRNAGPGVDFIQVTTRDCSHLI